jgi:predicted enzyme related to lactoylglutathione lyase
MKRVTGIGGVFIKARDPEALGIWYKRHLGIDIREWGGFTFHWHTPEEPNPHGATVWGLFKENSGAFGSGTAPFMINYRVHDLAALLDALRSEGCAVEPKTEDSEYGKFGWVTDPEGNRVELWEPPTGPAAD